MAAISRTIGLDGRDYTTNVGSVLGGKPAI